MPFLSDEFRRKMLMPIDELFEEAIDGMPPIPSSGGRNQQRFDTGMLGNVATQSPDQTFPPGKPGKMDKAALQDAMTELNGMIGLKPVKLAITRLTDYALVESERRKLKLPQTGMCFHTVFSGAPGTGKTSVARLFGRILCAVGLLPRGHTVEVSKSNLCGKYLGETPHLVEQAFNRADGGVLFIDEAYSLVRGDDDFYGTEAIDALVKLMEDRRDRVVVIVAGYDVEMRKFINANPGLRSRFNRSIQFPSYSDSELQSILKQLCRSRGFEATQGFLLRSELLWQSLSRQNLTSDANGRLVRSAYEFCLENQAARLAKSKWHEPWQLCQLLPVDLDHVEERLRENSHD